jgi:hypothetical protein
MSLVGRVLTPSRWMVVRRRGLAYAHVGQGGVDSGIKLLVLEGGNGVQCCLGMEEAHFRPFLQSSLVLGLVWGTGTEQRMLRRRPWMVGYAV